MKFLTPAQFKVALAAVAAAVAFCLQYNLVPVEFVPVVGFLSTYLAGIVKPGTKETPNAS